MRLRRRKSQFTSLPEVPSPKPQSHKTSKNIYLLILTSLGLYLVFHVMTELYYIRADGVVKTATHRVVATKTATIDRILVEQGQQVVKGQPLVKMIDSTTAEQDRELSTKRNELILIKNKLHQLEQALLQPRLTMAVISNQFPLLLNERLINIGADIARAGSRLYAQRQILKQAANDRVLELRIHQVDVVAAQQEEAALRVKLATLYKLLRSELEMEKQRTAVNIEPLEQEIGQMQNTVEVLSAPLEGHVVHIQKRDHDNILPRESILEIEADDSETVVWGFFASIHAPILKKQTQISIQFEGEDWETGQVVDMFSRSALWLEQLHYDGRIAEIGWVVEIHPQTQQQKKRWRNLAHSKVNLKFNRWQLPFSFPMN